MIPPQYRHLLSRAVIQHLCHKVVAALACGIRADHIRHAILRLSVHRDVTVLLPRPLWIGNPDIIVIVIKKSPLAGDRQL